MGWLVGRIETVVNRVSKGSVVRLMCAVWRDLVGGVGWMAGLRVIQDGIS